MSHHTVEIQNNWTFQIWDNDTLNLKTTNLLKEIDDLNADLKITPKNVKNVITQFGLEELAKSRVPGTTKTTNSHCAIGIGTTEETQADTALEAEVQRKAITTSSAYSTTERYATSFNHAGTDRDITEAGIYTADADDANAILISHVTTQSPALLRSGKTLTVTSTISHRYKNP